ncbi:anti-sigma factor [Candidatus Synechococcus calcipolaris G9]|uniref:Anti-sigma factor n=1 Tax=Candidatus Synechococcus calcipolaris G9 TaxID=1497997 RepID=A0ABT6F293_9SYNE|nr:anti-sigma factor [Candidatus Synechococcus calcipolaris]MDG2991954.1 anti-sigma factor [Candidatus Synechococcus calcipolaris G9]
MSDANIPQEWEELLAGYVLGDLSSEEARTVQELLTDYPELLAEIQHFQDILALLPLALPEVPVPQTLRSQILASEMGASEMAAQKTRRLPSPSPLRWWGLGGMALLIGLGWLWDSYSLRQQIASMEQSLEKLEHIAQETPAPRGDRTLMLEGMGPTSNATGMVAFAPQYRMAVVSIDNLPPLPSGQVYRLWAAIGDEKVECSEIVPDASGRVYLKLPLDSNLMNSTALVITIEPETPFPQPQGEMVMQGFI